MVKLGRPRKYQSPKIMQEAIEEYFAEHNEKGKRPTITGLALYLGFWGRLGLYNYEGYSQEFENVVKNARARVEESYELDLRKPACSGSIFALKNMKDPWTDKQEISGKDGAALLAPVIHVMAPQLEVQEPAKLPVHVDSVAIEGTANAKDRRRAGESLPGQEA